MSTVMSTATSPPMSPGSIPTNPIPRLRRGVSLIVGMDNQPMLFDSDSGKYHRLGAAAAFIVNQFDGVRPLPTIIEELPEGNALGCAFSSASASCPASAASASCPACAASASTTSC